MRSSQAMAELKGLIGFIGAPFPSRNASPHHFAPGDGADHFFAVRRR